MQLLPTPVADMVSLSDFELLDMTEGLGRVGESYTRAESSVQGHPSLSTAWLEKALNGMEPGSRVPGTRVRTNHCACNGGPGPFT